MNTSQQNNRKCAYEGCDKNARCNTGESIWSKYCPKHTERLKRNGSLELKKNQHGLEKIPHEYDYIIKENSHLMDIEIVPILKNLGINATSNNVKYRRRKLGIKKYDGSNSKERAKRIAIQEYGSSCEVCGYKATVDCHHVIEKKKGIDNSVSNLMILCPNCHALITRGIVSVSSRNEIEKLKKDIASICHNTSYT